MSIIVSLIGPIEHWWDTPEDPDRFNSPPAVAYRAWRQHVNDVLLAAGGFLVYRPHEGFKGDWDNRAQIFNDEMIRISDVVLCLRPPGIPGKGTDEELRLCAKLGKPVVFLPPGAPIDLNVIRGVVTMSATVSNIRPTVSVWINEDAEVRPDIVEEIGTAVHNALDEVAKRFLDPDSGIDVLVV
jgi:hypothetical protein